jgi:hypothetical protein
MIALNARASALAALDTCYLFGFAMKLLYLPADATHLLRLVG